MWKVIFLPFTENNGLLVHFVSVLSTHYWIHTSIFVTHKYTHFRHFYFTICFFWCHLQTSVPDRFSSDLIHTDARKLMMFRFKDAMNAGTYEQVSLSLSHRSPFFFFFFFFFLWRDLPEPHLIVLYIWLLIQVSLVEKEKTLTSCGRWLVGGRQQCNRKSDL